MTVYANEQLMFRFKNGVEVWVYNKACTERGEEQCYTDTCIPS